LRIGNLSSADFSSPNFDFKSIEPFKHVHNDRKYMFYGSIEEIPFISIENNDIKLPHSMNKSNQY
jgi:hypothetical protein